MTMAHVDDRRDETTQADLTALFRDEVDGVYRTMLAFTGGRADIAEEATAEAFARAVAQGPALRDPLAWVYRAAFRVGDRRDPPGTDARHGRR